MLVITFWIKSFLWLKSIRLNKMDYFTVLWSSVKLLIFCEPLCSGQNSVSLNSMSLAHDYWCVKLFVYESHRRSCPIVHNINNLNVHWLNVIFQWRKTSGGATSRARIWYACIIEPLPSMRDGHILLFCSVRLRPETEPNVSEADLINMWASLVLLLYHIGTGGYLCHSEWLSLE